jgi:hypothetical protein
MNLPQPKTYAHWKIWGNADTITLEGTLTHGLPPVPRNAFRIAGNVEFDGELKLANRGVLHELDELHRELQGIKEKLNQHLNGH